MKVGRRRIEAITVRRFITSFWSFAIFAWLVVADAGEQVAREVEPVGRAQELVVGGVERDLDVVGEDLRPVLDLDRVVDHAAHGVAHRR